MQPLLSHVAVSFVIRETCLWCSDDRVFLAVDISAGGSVGADFEYETPDIAVYINYFVNVVVELEVAILFLLLVLSAFFITCS